MELSRGQIVKSLSGRDKDRYFVILDIEDGYVWLADGKVRKLEHPKRKKNQAHPDNENGYPFSAEPYR